MNTNPANIENIRKGESFFLIAGGDKMTRGDYDRDSKCFYARAFGYSDVFKIASGTPILTSAQK